MSGMMLALIRMNINAFPTYWIVWRRRILHPDEAHKGTGIVDSDGYLVMQRPFVVALGSVVFALA